MQWLALKINLRLKNRCTFKNKEPWVNPEEYGKKKAQRQQNPVNLEGLQWYGLVWGLQVWRLVGKKKRSKKIMQNLKCWGRDWGITDVGDGARPHLPLHSPHPSLKSVSERHGPGSQTTPPPQAYQSCKLCSLPSFHQPLSIGCFSSALFFSIQGDLDPASFFSSHHLVSLSQLTSFFKRRSAQTLSTSPVAH